MKIEALDIKKIKTDQSNPNVMSKQKKKALIKSIEKFGELQPIIIDKNNVIIDGYHRYEAYKELKKLVIPAIRINTDKVSDKKLLRQLMNKIRGEHNKDKDAVDLKVILEDYKADELAERLGSTEDDILKIVDILNKDNVEEKKVEQVDKVYTHKVKCPFCHKEFEKKQSK